MPSKNYLNKYLNNLFVKYLYCYFTLMTKEEFKKIRTHLGETQKEFADRLDLTETSICLKENGRVPVTKKDIKKIGKFLKFITPA